MISIVGSFASVENDYRRERIAHSWSRNRWARRGRGSGRPTAVAVPSSVGAPCAA
ncbi:MAG: hypothetical protein QOE01_340 [Actinomycetota bacterium]|jgi:hypothetical protein|nr:hypothetical protein [Actinomycetota bacterium]MDQ1616014.1 hypothetical protein [Actinomycetota bacterium]